MQFQVPLEVQELGHGLLTFALVKEVLKTPPADKAPKDGEIVADSTIRETSYDVAPMAIRIPISCVRCVTE